MDKNKIQLMWSMACEDVIVDQRTNKISIINALEQIEIGIKKDHNVKDKINIPINFSVVSLWERIEDGKVEKHNFKLTLFSPKDEEILEKNITIEFKEEALKIRSISLINNLSLDVLSGRYFFKIQTKNVKNEFLTISEIPLYIKFKKRN